VLPDTSYESVPKSKVKTFFTEDVLAQGPTWLNLALFGKTCISSRNKSDCPNAEHWTNV